MKHYLNTVCAAALALPALAHSAEVAPYFSSGQILVSEVVRLLAGNRGGHEMLPLGELALKGLATPISASEVVWTPAGSVAGAGTGSTAWSICPRWPGAFRVVAADGGVSAADRVQHDHARNQTNRDRRRKVAAR